MSILHFWAMPFHGCVYEDHCHKLSVAKKNPKCHIWVPVDHGVPKSWHGHMIHVADKGGSGGAPPEKNSRNTCKMVPFRAILVYVWVIITCYVLGKSCKLGYQNESYGTHCRNISRCYNVRLKSTSNTVISMKV